ncbi:leucyl/phenylalanyl-tRNA--protein transferase [Sinobacterium caligoides]|uniref:Leucyl/phenylalanyl-tRNA--protein transferase n=1 Tax=Sinobacterium caligoides TaxID=933926 RepID=A0A3N2DXL4_9GAMM|nr:leucyl/phenylalanyl-tRNA--protein transferase [Sinobacterium caligoides]ROS04561.1 leucyl/phenylalanyl-tRNA--protein transferase [Sinobacterium caligoides]
MTIPWLPEDSCIFPPVNSALKDPDGLLAAGGDLSPETLLSAYKNGIFPWYDQDQPILWWSPDPRTIVEPQTAHASRSLKKFIRKHPPTVTFDQDFSNVIKQCRLTRENKEGTWITDEMEAAYNSLYRMGYAHSVEVWDEDELIGGLYGIALGRAFFGESMFSLRDNSSKIAFITLSKYLQHWQFELIDCQVESEHLLSLGAQVISRDSFIERINTATIKATQIDWQVPPGLLASLSQP